MILFLPFAAHIQSLTGFSFFETIWYSLPSYILFDWFKSGVFFVVQEDLKAKLRFL